MEIASLNTVKTKLECTHCGEHCEDDKIAIEDKYFCCEGCKMVYGILNENDLCTFYDIEKMAGVSLKGKQQKTFAFLDDEEVRTALLDFTDGRQSKVKFYLPQIHCASCVWLLENLYRLNEGVLNSRINFLKKEIYLSYDEQLISLRQIVELLDSIGYEPEINLSQLDQPKHQAVSRKLYYQLGVAGFAFGNIMLLSFPEYLGLAESSFGYWLGYLNLLLALPVIIYSGQDYLRSAWLGLKERQLNIDVPISLGMLTLFGRSAFEILTHSGAGYMDSMAGLVFFLLIGKWFQQKTYYTLSFERDYKSYFPIAASIKQGDKWVSTPLQKVEVGQIMQIKHQELIPTDGVLTKGQGFIDYAFVTGESEPVRKEAGEKVYAGGRQMGATIELTVSRKVAQSYLTQLWNEHTFKEEEEGQASQLANQVGRYFTIVILAIATLTLLYWLKMDTTIAFNAFTAVLIIACPCAVALAIPFTYGNVLRILGRNQFYLKNTNIIEYIQQIRQIIFDKTGTITDLKQQTVSYEGVTLSEHEKQMIKALAKQSSHPKSRALAAHFKGMAEVPVLAVMETAGAGISGEIAGHQLRIGSGDFMTRRSSQAGVHLEIDGVFKGRFFVQHAYRSELKNFIQQLASEYQLGLLSGDNDRERRHLLSVFPAGSTLQFEQTPKDKLEHIQKSQAEGQKVMMIGDGLNDAGALKQSDVGIVITENINNFTPACDAILAADEFDHIPDFFEYIKQSRKVVFGAYLLALIYNTIGLSFAVRGLLSPVIAAILMPLSSITIVVFGMLGSTYLAWRMGLLQKDDQDHFKA